MPTVAFTDGIANAYLIEADDGYLLIDTGEPDQYEAFLSKLDDAGVEPGEIEYLLLTHHHRDHVGFVGELLHDVTVIAHESAPALLAAGETESGGKLTNRRVYGIAWLLGAFGLMELTFPPIELRPEDVLVDGRNDQVLRDIGVEGTIVPLPGHTRDSIGVLLDDGRLFCGDVACNFPRVLGLGAHPLLVTDCQTLYESWATILDSHAETLFPGHGSPFPAEALRAQLDRFESEDLFANPIDDR